MSERHPETDAIRTQIATTGEREHSTPLYLTSSYLFESTEQARALFANEEQGNVYSRYSNPNTSEFIEKMCRLEGAEAGVSTASGMAAVFSSMAALLNHGDHLIACRSVFGSTHQIFNQIFPRWGIEHTYVDLDRTDQWEEAIRPETRLLYLETPTNPGLGLIDLEWASKLAKAHDLILVVDNCFATPWLQKPMQYGADLVVHSATKYIDGQGRTLGGVIVGKPDLIDRIQSFTRHSGPALSPFNAWLFSKSLETLPVRMDRHCDNAEAVADVLEKHRAIDRVIYPFLESHPQRDLARKQMTRGGGIVCIEVSGGYDRARDLIDRLQMLSRSANLGDTRTIVTHPASTTHSKLSEEERTSVGISNGLVRIAVGLEHPEDILKDLDQALG